MGLRRTSLVAAVLPALAAGCTSSPSGPSALPTTTTPTAAVVHVGASLPACTAAEVGIRQIGRPGPAAGSIYQLLEIDNRGRVACTIARLGVYYVNASHQRVGSPSLRWSRPLNEGQARVVGSVVLRVTKPVYLRIAVADPLNFGRHGCDAAEAAREIVVVNSVRLWLPTTLGLCPKKNRPQLAIADVPTPPPAKWKRTDAHVLHQ